jgi:hypothetical protein
LGEIIDDLSKTHRTGVGNGFEESGDLGDPELIHSVSLLLLAWRHAVALARSEQDYIAAMNPLNRTALAKNEHRRPAAFEDLKAAGRQPVQTNHGGELPIGRQAEYASARHVAKEHIAAMVEDGPFKRQTLFRNLEPGCRHSGLQGAFGWWDRNRASCLRIIGQAGGRGRLLG